MAPTPLETADQAETLLLDLMNLVPAKHAGPNAQYDTKATRSALARVTQCLRAFIGHARKGEFTIEKDPESQRGLLQHIDKRFDKLEMKLDKQPPPQPPSSYASVLRRATDAPATPRRPARTSRAGDILVRIVDQKEREAMRTSSHKDILERIQRGAGAAPKRVLGVYKHPSGDINVSAANENDKVSMEADTTWLKGVAGTAQVIRRRYAVQVHGVRISDVNTDNLQQAITQVMQRNRALHPGLGIKAIRWTRPTQGKIHGSLVIQTECPSQANRLLDEGMVMGYQLHACTPYHPGTAMLPRVWPPKQIVQR